MDNSPEFWAYVAANVCFVVISTVLAGLSVFTYYRRRGQKSYLIASAGFGCILTGGLAEAIYALWLEPFSRLSGKQFLLLQAGEDVVIALGLGLLFLAITQHESRTPTVDDVGALLGEDDRWITGGIDDD